MSRFSLAVVFSLAVAAKADIYGCFAPATADVSFGAYEIDCGSVVPYSTGHYAATPLIKYADSDDESFYVVAMVDPDAPSAADPTYREVRHFLVGNVIGSELRNNGADWEGADVLSPFKNPAPPEGSGAHRYVQLVYAQPAGAIAFDPVDPSIVGFNVTAFAAQYGLGAPVASNYFTVEYACSGHYEQCSGGVDQEAAICCAADGDDCYAQNGYFGQCRESCPEGLGWACENATAVLA